LSVNFSVSLGGSLPASLSFLNPEKSYSTFLSSPDPVTLIYLLEPGSLSIALSIVLISNVLSPPYTYSFIKSSSLLLRGPVSLSAITCAFLANIISNLS
jgi:hypothetical protein